MPGLGLLGGQTLPTPPSPPAPTGASSLAITSTMPPPLAPVVIAWDPSLRQNAWMFFTLKGLASPGTIPRGGIKGFKRETGWDEANGKGSAGAQLILTKKPPCRGSIIVQLITAQDFTDWDNFVAQVLAIPEQNQLATGLTIFHPSFSSIGLTTVVVKHFSPPEEQRPGLYYCTIEFIEWSAPPAQSVVATVSTTAPEQDNTAAGVPPQNDPTIYAQQVTAALWQQAATP